MRGSRRMGRIRRGRWRRRRRIDLGLDLKSLVVPRLPQESLHVSGGERVRRRGGEEERRRGEEE